MKQVIWLLLKMEEGLPTVTDQKQTAGMRGEKEIKYMGKYSSFLPPTACVNIGRDVHSSHLCPFNLSPH